MIKKSNGEFLRDTSLCGSLRRRTNTPILEVPHCTAAKIARVILDLAGALAQVIATIRYSQDVYDQIGLGVVAMSLAFLASENW